MNETNEQRLQQLKETRHTTMVELVYASQAAYDELEKARTAYAAIKRWQFLKKRTAKQNVAAKVAKMVQLEKSIEAAHQAYQQGLKELED